MKKKIVVAVDGPAGAGKGTLCSILAKDFNLAYLDTGTLYRSVTYLMLKDGADVNSESIAEKYAKNLTTEDALNLGASNEIRSSEVNANVATVASYAKVRKALREYQVNFAKNPPREKGGAILDGRDIGTTICPDADVKLFVNASPEVRAIRRQKQLAEKGEKVDLDTVLRQTIARDKKDQMTSGTTLMAPEDSIIVRNDENATIEDIVMAASNEIMKAQGIL